jgi:hypothetical protein
MSLALNSVLFRIRVSQFLDVLQLPLDGGQVRRGCQIDGVEVRFAVDQCSQKLRGISGQTGPDVFNESDPNLLQVSHADCIDRHAGKLSLEDLC